MKIFLPFILNLLFICNGTSQVHDDYLQGMADLSRGNYQSSIVSFSTALTNNPISIKYLRNRGIAYFYNNNFSEAEKDFRLAIEHNDAESIIWLAKINSANNNPILSVKYLEEYFEKNNPVNTRQILKDESFKTIHYSKEWQDFVSAEWESNIEKIINETEYYLKKGQFDRGLTTINKGLLSNNNNAELLYLRAKLYLRSENIPLAISDAYKASGAYPNKAKYKTLLARLYYQNKEYEKSIQIYTSVLDMKPELFEVYPALAKAQLSNNNSAGANATINNYLQYFDKDTSALFLSSEIYYVLEEYQNALKLLNKLIENNKAQSNWYLKRGLCYEKTGTYKYAAADLSMCLDLEPSNTKANLHLGIVQQKLNNPESACYYWERALRAGELSATEYILEYCE